MSALASQAPALAGALGLLAAAAVVAGGRPGRIRLSDLDRRRTPMPDGSDPVLRRSGRGVGVLAGGLLGGVLAGPVAAVLGAGLAGLLGGLAVRAAAAGSAPGGSADGLAERWELLAICLQAGLPVATAVTAATDRLAGPVGEHLRRISGLLALGADPASAWASAEAVPALAAFARAAGRSAGTGAALAHVATVEAERLRADLLDSAQARAQRAAVLITGPLGLCFLPAFLVLGIAPVVIGLASEALAQW
jgi:pilus assembly protein TadC